MKKIAMSLTAATLLVSGLAGCGDVNDTGMNDGQGGYNVNQGQGNGTNQGYNLGEGRNNQGGFFGRNTNRGFDQGGMFGQNRDRNNQGGFFGQNDRNQHQGSYGFNRGREYTGNNQENRGLGNTTETRGIGQRNGYNFQQNEAGSHGLNQGTRGQNRMTGFEARENRQHRGFGRGITGNDRPGMVDEDGILNGRRANVTGQNRTLRGQNGTIGQQGNLRGQNKTHGSQSRSLGNQNGTLRGQSGTYRGQNEEAQQNRTTTGQNGSTMGFNRSNRGFSNGATNGQRTSHNRNNHGLTNNNGYYNGEDGRLARRITSSLGQGNNHVLVNGNDVIVAVDEDGNANESEIRNSVGNVRDDLNVHVVSDRDQVRQVRGMNDRLRAGEPFEEIGATFNDMLEDLGNAASRPFERSR
ncbi:YhcN/YlaJ family sporulation lipoprotein [Evansella tamaricis]|uniref:YhcN/YlaJ family sporulation lipoprotein n=1 Tax=Evansella tamaricis TaxID=2069301 RepID=A0ABS6JJZ6_9BACI|nr:YhcN/YlaJ family sporulation lipoprotein [Evansella tamaricis]MBU9713982.1 YhcN/YlaJ family sporulation lipoprotein [Evansella tamaricis]